MPPLISCFFSYTHRDVSRSETTTRTWAVILDTLLLSHHHHSPSLPVTLFHHLKPWLMLSSHLDVTTIIPFFYATSSIVLYEPWTCLLCLWPPGYSLAPCTTVCSTLTQTLQRPHRSYSSPPPLLYLLLFSFCINDNISPLLLELKHICHWTDRFMVRSLIKTHLVKTAGLMCYFQSN